MSGTDLAHGVPGDATTPPYDGPRAPMHGTVPPGYQAKVTWLSAYARAMRSPVLTWRICLRAC
eukprot:3941744-Rhodomonas_salina.1